MRTAGIVAAILVLAGVLLFVLGLVSPPLGRTCADGIDAAACSGAVDAVMRRGLPQIHPLILASHVEPGTSSASETLGHRASVSFDLLGVPGPVTVELHYDEGGHWGGVLDRSEPEVAAWALLPILLALLAGTIIVGLAWRRRRSPTG